MKNYVKFNGEFTFFITFLYRAQPRIRETIAWKSLTSAQYGGIITLPNTKVLKEKTMRNRILRVTLALLLTSALLFSMASCSNTPNDESVGSKTTTQDKDPGSTGGLSGNKQLSGKLSISQCWNFLNLQGAIDQFTKIHPNVEIVLNKYDSDWEKYWAQVGAQLIAGTGDDILDASDFSYVQLADRGFLADFNKLMRDDPRFNEDDYYSNVFKGLEYKGGLYNFPTLLSLSGL